MIYAVTRHGGAKDWLAQNVTVDVFLTHASASTFSPGDAVIGLLPVHLAAALTEKGVRYFHLCLDLPEDKRGVELSAEEMARYNPRLVEFSIVKVKDESN